MLSETGLSETERSEPELGQAVLSVETALHVARQWSSVDKIGNSPLPMLVVDLRGVERRFRIDDQDTELARLLVAAPWVNVGIVDDHLDPVFAHLADSLDVLIGDGTDSAAAVDVDDVQTCLAELRACIHASPQAAVALAQLLRTSHNLPIPQALHAESLTYAMLQTSDQFTSWLGKRNARQPAGDLEAAVLVERNASMLDIRLNRPHVRNALNVAMRDQLVEALELLDLDRSIDGAVLSGIGPNFCAGGDLNEFGTSPSPAVGHRVRSLRSVPALMHRVTSRLRVHLHGACVGAGIELPAFAGSIIAHPDSTFHLPEVAFGLIPGAGGTVSITRRCGRHRTAWLAITGTTIDAAQALRWQLIDRIDPSPFDLGGSR